MSMPLMSMLEFFDPITPAVGGANVQKKTIYMVLFTYIFRFHKFLTGYPTR